MVRMFMVTARTVPANCATRTVSRAITAQPGEKAAATHRWRGSGAGYVRVE